MNGCPVHPGVAGRRAVGSWHCQATWATAPRWAICTLVLGSFPWCSYATDSVDSRESDALDLVYRAQTQRVQMIEHAAPSVVCVFDAAQRGGGSGVLIDREGYGLTNFHVVQGLLETRRGWGGLSDGKLYELEVLGIDPTGDVAMFRLLGRDGFPFAPLGDSDAVQVGDAVVAMGNPFTLSEDYTPSVSSGIVTGTHRYQKGVKGNLTYSDCIQVDAPINPGNSGGPLFNRAGEIIGINGRISINQRGRFNVGFGYAITSNQIRRFVPALRAGLLAKHGTLQAIVEDRGERGVLFTELIRHACAYEAGIRIGDRLVEFDGIPIVSANHFASVLGTYPAAWRVPLVIERDGVRRRTVARLEPITPNIGEPFFADLETNLRQVRRVLHAYQSAVTGGGSCLPGFWHWTVDRRYAADDSKRPGAAEHFDVFRWEDGTTQMRQTPCDRSSGKIIEYDADHVILRARHGADVDALAEPEKLVLRALQRMQGGMLGALDDLDPKIVTHAGGTAPMPDSSGLRQPARWPLEVIDWRMGDHATARYAFDLQTHWIVRVTVRDLPTDSEVMIELSNHRDVGGVVRPCRIKVHGAGLSYEDVLAGWELTP